MHTICFFVCIVTLITAVVIVSMFSDDGMEINVIPPLSRMSANKELHNKTETILIPHSVTSI